MGYTSDKSGADLLLPRVGDAVALCQKREFPCFLGFFDEREQQQVIAYLKKQSSVCWLLDGGHPDAERKMLCVFPPYYQPEQIAFPLQQVAFRYRREKHLSHRDFLGTMMSAGLRRETVGDILCSDGLAVVFLRDEIADYVSDQISAVGGEGVTIQRDYEGELPVFHRFSPVDGTVASPRLDAVLKVLLHCSREQAAQMIRTGTVEVDHCPVSSVSGLLTAPVTVSVRGIGRFAVDQIGPQTAKGRYAVKARKYI